MNSTRLASLIVTVIAAAAGLSLACRDHTGVTLPPPPSGLQPPPPSLRLSLHDPNPTDGAVFLELRGPGLKNEVSVNEGSQVFTEIVGDTLLRVVVVGSLQTGFLMVVPVRDRQLAANYEASIIEVADRSGIVRSSTSNYTVNIEAQ